MPVLTVKKESSIDILVNSGMPEIVTGMAFLLSGHYHTQIARNAKGELDRTELLLEMVTTGKESKNMIGEYRCYTKGNMTLCTEKTFEILQTEQKLLKCGQDQQYAVGYGSIAFGMAVIFWGLNRTFNHINYEISTMKANKELMKG